MPNGTISNDSATTFSSSHVVPVVDMTALPGSRNKKMPLSELASASALAGLASSAALTAETAARVASDAILSAAVDDLVAYDVSSSAALAAVVADVLAADAALQDQIDVLSFQDVALTDLIEDTVAPVDAALAVLEAALDGGATGAVLTKSSGADYAFVWTAKTYQLKGALGGVPDANQWFGGDAVAVALTIPANFAGAYAHARAAATASYVISVQKNGVQIGTITFAAAGVTGTFATTSGLAQSAAAGDRITLVGQATADITIADIYFTLVGTYV